MHRFILCLNYIMFPLVCIVHLRQRIAKFAVAEGWLLLDSGWFVLFFSQMASASFCGLTNIYTTKFYATRYDADINNTGKICWSLNLLTVHQVSWPNWYGSSVIIQVSWVEVPLWANTFLLWNVYLRSLQLTEDHVNKTSNGIYLANTLFYIYVQ